MSCYAPLHGYRARSSDGSPPGKRRVVFSVAEGFADLPVTVPCGQCVGCRLERSRQWAVRCMHEASLYEANCFVTLTYADQFLPAHGSLDKSAFQKFMKRLRKRFSAQRIRFFHCGEYGETNGRPHFHVLLFGFDFPDKELWTTRKGLPVWRSATLEELWPFGQSEIGSVTFESAAYVARYVVKKVTGRAASDYYQVVDPDTGEVQALEPEYATMSRKPGIGRAWLDRYMSEVYPSDSVVVRGREMKPPHYYDEVHEVVAPAEAARVRARRVKAVRLEDQEPERLLVRERCAVARLEQSERMV